jgi:hypothetical protein
MGFTPDEIKNTPEWRFHHTSYHSIFQNELRPLNAWYARTFKREIREEIHAKRAARYGTVVSAVSPCGAANLGLSAGPSSHDGPLSVRFSADKGRTWESLCESHAELYGSMLTDGGWEKEAV